MKLRRVHIENYKSIHSAKLEFDHNCKILVGKNESGKSSVLESVSFLGEERFKSEDVRLRTQLGNGEEKAEIRYVFDFDDDDFEAVAETFKGRQAPAGSLTISVNDGGEIELSEYIKRCFSGGLTYARPDNKNHTSYYSPKKIEKYDIADKNILIVPAKTPAGMKAKFHSDDYDVSAFFCITKDAISTTYQDNQISAFTALDLSSLNKEIGRAIIAHIEQNSYECYFWAFDEKNLVKDEIKIDDYIATPEKYKAISNILLLYGIENPVEAMKTKVKDADRNIVDNFLDQVSEKLTAYINGIWKEYSEIKLELRYSDDHLTLYVLEHDKKSWKYKPSQRSYGFKKFLLFLLDVSIELDYGSKDNCLVLIDEPEIGLHPSAVEYFKEKLIEISEQKNVLLLYSTHSEHAIDRRNISRHYIVTKAKEDTFLTQADMSSYYKEQVLLNALGSSAFRQIKEKNIIFEGWTDHFVFNEALATSRTGYKIADNRKFFENVGAAFVDGARQVKKFTPIMQLADKSCFILTDSDEQSLTARKDFQKNKLYGDWHTYGSVLKNNSYETLEDFIKTAEWKKQVNACKSIDVKIPATYYEKRPRLSELRKELSKLGVAKEDVRKICNEIKKQLFEGEFKPNMLENEYFDMLEKLEKKLS